MGFRIDTAGLGTRGTNDILIRMCFVLLLPMLDSPKRNNTVIVLPMSKRARCSIGSTVRGAMAMTGNCSPG